MIPPIIILAGGLAKRLRPLTKKIPKSMVYVNSKPFIYYQLKLLEKFRFEKIIISTGYKGKIIENYIKKNKKINKKNKIFFINDGKIQRGTGGAIKNCLKLIKKDFFIIYGDSYFNLNFKLVYKSFVNSKKNCLMTVLKNNNKYDKSNMLIKKNKIIKYDKNSTTAKHIDYGVSCFKKHVFSKTKKNSFDLSEINKSLIKTDEIKIYYVKKRFYEIGTLNGLNQFKNYIKKN